MIKQKEIKDRRFTFKRKLRDIIFESDTFYAKTFDVLLLIAILISVLAVLLESVQAIEIKFGSYLRGLEWVFTILFTIEYIARIITVRRSFRYIFSFFGIVDLVSIIPTYLSLFFFGTQYLLVVRSLRLLRVFRILKFARYMDAATGLGLALRKSRQKITVFLGVILTIVFIMGTLMYIIEGGDNGFTSIPKSIYWAIVTLTTVGYGDIAPQSIFGQFLASVLMIMGYVIIAVPTGIITVELTKHDKKIENIACPSCTSRGHDDDATFCKFCGEKIK